MRVLLNISLLYTVLVFPQGIEALKFRGLDPSQQEFYESSLSKDESKWGCLSDRNIQLDISQINDGICDCPDGSDEPGTFACSDVYNTDKISNYSSNVLENRLFYCENKGFLPRYISGSLVDDGVCDCCDCSDESSIKGENTCKQLNEVYAQIFTKEMKHLQLGKTKIVDLYKRAGIDISIDSVSTERALVESHRFDITALDNDISTNENMLRDEQAHLFTRLKKESPMLYDFESINFDYLMETINSTYTKISKASKSFTDLNYILATLSKTYSPNLKDRVVINNINRYNKKITELEQTQFAVDGDIDLEQSEQLVTYLSKELPDLFWEHQSEYPSDYVINKARFVRALVGGKVAYADTTFRHVDSLMEIMNDIAENHNVNFQDQGVKSAIQSYSDYLGKYSDFVKRRDIKLPEEYNTEMEKLFHLLEINVPKLISNDEKVVGKTTVRANNKNGHDGLDSTGDDDNQLFGFLLRLKDGVMGRFSNLKSLKEQINDRKGTIRDMKIELHKKKDELKNLLEIEEEKKYGDSTKEMLLRETRLITELLEKLAEEDVCTHSTINGYIYAMCLAPNQPGVIYQTESGENGKAVRIGTYQGLYLDKGILVNNYMDNIKTKYPDTNILKHLVNSTQVVGQDEYYIGNLESVNNGLIVDFGNGDVCWNGPRRSAKVVIKCSDKLRINDVQELSKCSYLFDVEGPFGCVV